MFVPLAEADAQCGAKAFGLKGLLDAGIPVPDGWVILDPRQEGWKEQLDAWLRRLGPGPYAVRSSALDEDGAEASYAGQLHTSLNLRTPEQVAAAVRRTAGSADTPGSRAYAEKLARLGRTAAGDTRATGVVPVVVQNMVDPEAAGVAFTRHPVTGAEQVVIEAVAGLGDRLVDGSRTPERWVVDGDAVSAPDAPPPDTAVLTEARAIALAAMSRRIEELSGCPQDVEWAVAGGKVWVLQARPITTTPRGRKGIRARGAGEVLAAGTPASPGIASGPVRIVSGLDDFGTFEAGDVLVCRATSPAWTPLLARACAVVTETGGMLAHAAIVAREFGIPAVLAATAAMTTLSDGQRVVVDGTTGTVTSEERENHEEREEREEPDERAH